MPSAVSDDLLTQQIRAILADPGQRASLGLGVPFTQDQAQAIEDLTSQVGGIVQNSSLGGALSGPQWFSGVALMNGTVSATALKVNTLDAVTTNTGSLNVTGNMVAAAAFPAVAARIVLNSTGLVGYSGAVDTTFKLLTDGSGEIGTGTGKITWTTAGVVTVPAAVIGSLTIAAVGGGVLGGTYQSSVNTTRIELSSSGMRALTVGTETFKLDATTGAMTVGGTFTVQSATSGARVVISNAGGIELYKSNGIRSAFLNAATGAGFLGTDPGTIAWDSSGNVTVNGSVLVTGSVAASAISASTLSAISANLGTITAGTINASLVTISNLTASNITGGTLNGSVVTISNISASNITTGTLNASVVSVTNLNASNITTGTLSASLIGSGTLSGDRIYGGTAYLTRVDAGNFYGTAGDFTSLVCGTLRVSGTNGGSAASWSTFTTANIPDKSAGYFLVDIWGTSYRVPFYANS